MFYQSIDANKHCLPQTIPFTSYLNVFTMHIVQRASSSLKKIKSLLVIKSSCYCNLYLRMFDMGLMHWSIFFVVFHFVKSCRDIKLNIICFVCFRKLNGSMFYLCGRWLIEDYWRKNRLIGDQQNQRSNQ